MLSETVLLEEKKGYVLYLTLNRPKVRNALSSELMTELAQRLGRVKEDASVRVVVLRGAGDKAFCAGGDLTAMLENSKAGIDALRKNIHQYAEVILAVHRVGKPIIAQVHGYALAGGCGLAAACDITLVSDDAVFGVPEINIGLWGMVITAPLVRAVGPKRAMELFYTGRRFAAQEACDLGLGTRVIPRDRLEEETEALADELAAKSPGTLKTGREAFLLARDMEFETSVKYLREMATLVTSLDDAQEGMAAFLEKRKPVWKDE